MAYTLRHRGRLGYNLEVPAGRCVFSASLNRQTLETVPPTMAIPHRVAGRRAVAQMLRSPIHLLHSIAGDLLTTLFPANCRSCQGPLVHAGFIPICVACLASLSPSALPSCWRCGEAMDLPFSMEDARFAAQMAATFRCRPCRMAEPAFERAVSFATYEGELRTLIGLLKFEGVPRLAKPLGRHLASAILKLEPLAGPELTVIAVPLAPARERQRGFNQSVLLADEALKELCRLRPAWKLHAAHHALKRVRRTEAQYVLSLDARRRNLRGAFAITGDVRGQEILLVDDIMTSGATARECARVLEAAGAAKVWVATLARAQKQEFLHAQEPFANEFTAWNAEHPIH